MSKHMHIRTGGHGPNAQIICSSGRRCSRTDDVRCCVTRESPFSNRGTILRRRHKARLCGFILVTTGMAFLACCLTGTVREAASLLGLYLFAPMALCAGSMGRRPRVRFQYSLRRLLALVTVAAVALSVWSVARELRARKLAVCREIRELGGHVSPNAVQVRFNESGITDQEFIDVSEGMQIHLRLNYLYLTDTKLGGNRSHPG